jgi:hypothetical protein
MADSDEEQLNLAIALSLQSHRAQNSPNRAKEPKGAVVDLTADGDDEDHAARPSDVHDHPKGSTQAQSKNKQASLTQPLRDNEDSSPSMAKHGEKGNERGSQAIGILGLDRKQMEQDRLARRQPLQGQSHSTKRNASISPPPLKRAAKIPKTEEISAKPISTRPRDDFPEQSATQRVKPAVVAHNPNLKIISLEFPEGVVRKTWASGHERNGDIKIEEVLQKSSLQLAVLSAFQWNMDWLLNKLRVGTTEILFIMQAKENATVSYSY